MTIWSRIARLFGALRDGQIPETRLSAREAIEIAREAAKDHPMRDQLSMASLAKRDGRLTWNVRQPVTGSSLEVDIDDGTGEIVQIETRGIR